MDPICLDVRTVGEVLVTPGIATSLYLAILYKQVYFLACLSSKRTVVCEPSFLHHKKITEEKKLVLPPKCKSPFSHLFIYDTSIYKHKPMELNK